MPDMYVSMVWLPTGSVDRSAGLEHLRDIGSVGVRDATGVEDIIGWGEDLQADVRRYERRSPSDQAPAPDGILETARLFVRALELSADPAVASRGLLTRIDLTSNGVILAAGGEYGGDTPMSVATLHCAGLVFPSVAESMGALPPSEWRISRSSG